MSLLNANADKENHVFDLNMHIARLLHDEPFYAYISRRVHKSVNRSIKTAGVYVDDRAHFHLEYNDEWMVKLTDKEIKGVLIHELLHIVLGHVTDRRPDEGGKKWNHSTDLAINSHLIDLVPENGCIPGKGKYSDMPVGKASEWYYSTIIVDEDEDGDGGFDEHGKWGGDGGGDSAMNNAMARNHLPQMVNSAINEANTTSNGWGTVPQPLQQEIIASLKTRVDWRSVLSNFINTSIRGEKENTRRRPNRRFGMLYPGTITNYLAEIDIAMDMSGSVSDQLLELFFGELQSFSELVSFRVIPFDWDVDVDNIFMWEKDAIHPAKRVRCGGTNFQAPTDYTNHETTADGLIILTDLEATVPGPCRVERMWMTDPHHFNNVNFDTEESIIVIDE